MPTKVNAEYFSLIVVINLLNSFILNVMANVRKLRNNSKASSTLCKECNKAVKDDDKSGICCHSCNSWVHGGCVNLSVTDVEWLGSKPNCLWVCNSCVNNEVFTNNSEDKLTSLFDSFTSKIKTSVAELIPKAIDESLPKVIIELNEKVKTAVVDSLPSYKDVVTGKNLNKSAPSSELNFVLTGASESGSTYFEQLEHDSESVNKILGHMGLKTEGNVTAVRRLGKKINPANNTPRSCRPLLISTSNSHFLQNCFARSHYLKTYTDPVYVKKFLTPTERKIEKAVLQKRYSMVSEGKKREDFRIKNLQLFYQGKPVETPTD